MRCATCQVELPGNIDHLFTGIDYHRQYCADHCPITFDEITCDLHGAKSMLSQIEPFAKPVVGAEQILACLFAEYDYWLKANCEASIGATGAIANVIAFATVRRHRADWHPQKRFEGVSEVWNKILDAPAVVWHCPKGCHGEVVWNNDCTVAKCSVCGVTSLAEQPQTLGEARLQAADGTIIKNKPTDDYDPKRPFY